MKSYLRFLGRNKMYTVIMAVGLSVSLAFVIIMSCFVWQNMRVNMMYPDQERIYIIGNKGTMHSNAVIAGRMKDAIPEIEAATVVKNSGTQGFSTIEGKQIDRRSFMGIEKNFFEWFPTRFIYGSEAVLNDANNAIITESLANVHGGEDVIGKKLNLGGFLELTISAVIEDFDDTIFDNELIIVNFGHPHFDVWRDSALGTFGSGMLSIVKIREGVDKNEILRKMDSIYEEEVPEKYHRDSYLSLTCLDEVYTSESNTGYDGLKKGNAGLMKAFTIIVIFLLISAIFNYINLSTALAGRRSKEIASRMLLGEDKKKVFMRNIYESLIFMGVCMFLGFLLAQLFIPGVNRLLNSPIPVEMKFSQGYIYMYLLTLGTTAVLCGLIPALISSSFKPIEIVKGSFRYKNKRTFSKVFIVIQNAIAIIIIAVSLTMESQVRHMINMPLNADTDSLFICNTYNEEFDKTLRELPYVEKFGRTQGRPGSCYATYGFPLNDDIDNLVTLEICECDSASFELFGFEVIKSYGLPMNEGAWLTESAARKLCIDLENPVFPKESSWTIGDKMIAGIIKDVPFNPAKSLNPEAIGVVIVCPQTGKYPDYVVKLSDPSVENIRELHELSTKEIVKTYGPEMAQTSGYLPDMIANVYDDYRRQITMVEIFMAIAILLSALGQIAMSTYYATEREKEISIRKVFGGTVGSESTRSIFEYMGYCLIASVLAIPVAVWVAGRYLETFVYKMNLPIWVFAVAALAVLAVSIASVLWQTLRAARTNPAEALKKE